MIEFLYTFEMGITDERGANHSSDSYKANNLKVDGYY